MILISTGRWPEWESKFESIKVGEGENPQRQNLLFQFVQSAPMNYTGKTTRWHFGFTALLQQKMNRDKVPGGTLSRGVDALAQKVDLSHNRQMV